MRSHFVTFSLHMSLVSLVAWGMCACGGGDEATSTTAGSTAATTGSGGTGAMGGNGGSGQTGPGSGGAGGTGSVTGTGGSGTGGSGTGGSGTGGSGTGGSGTGGSSACADTWVINYDLTGVFAITDTPFGLGNTSQPVGTGTLSLRFANNNGSPAQGPVTLLSYHLPMMFVVDTMGLVVTTDVEANSGPDTCGGIARGTLSNINLVWDTCTYDPTTWTTMAAGMGPGCIRNYHTTGNVNCNDMSPLASCMQGGLMDGDNPQDTTWHQPMNTFEFMTGLTSFRMRNLDGPNSPMGVTGVEVPNDSPGRTWLNLDGVETSRNLEPTPACACP